MVVLYQMANCSRASRGAAAANENVHLTTKYKLDISSTNGLNVKTENVHKFLSSRRADGWLNHEFIV